MSERLFSEFNKSSDEEWLKKISEELKGKSAKEISRHRPFESIDLKPFYSENDVETPIYIDFPDEWKISSEKDYTDNVFSDPIHFLVTKGRWKNDSGNDLKSFSGEYLSGSGKKRIGINGTPYQAAGASAVFELSLIVAHLNEYLNLLKPFSNKGSENSPRFCIRLNVGQDYFLEISKLRALRLLVSNLLQHYGINKNAFTVYAENSTINFSGKDMDGNILRSTTACMSAIIGGCDYLNIVSHTIRNKKDDLFGNRIARNIQLILKHEGHLGKVRDPASGSYYLEKLTKNLAELSWEKFKKIEKEGGFIQNFMNGKIQKEIQATAEDRIKRFTNQQDILVGINKYQIKNTISGDESGTSADNTGDLALKPLFLEDSI